MSKKQLFFFNSRREEKRHSSTSINPAGPVHVTFCVSRAPGIAQRTDCAVIYTSPDSPSVSYCKSIVSYSVA